MLLLEGRQRHNMAKKEKKIDNETKKIILEDGMKSDFWLIIKKELKESLSATKQALEAFPGDENMSAEKYKHQHKLLKQQKDNLINLKDLPEVLIMEIDGSSEDEEKPLDPFDPIEE